jgi:hypothetical protein
MVRKMKIFLDFLLFAIIIGIILYFAMFYGREKIVYACSEVTKEDPIEVQKKCKIK